jgi:hypothetical protein
MGTQSITEHIDTPLLSMFDRRITEIAAGLMIYDRYMVGDKPDYEAAYEFSSLLKTVANSACMLSAEERQRLAELITTFNA